MERSKDKFVGKKIIITKCWTIGHQYNKLFPKTIHTIIWPIEGEHNGDEGVWVKGTNFPVKVHFDEFEFYPVLKRTKF